MKHTTRFLLILALVATAASAAPGSSHANGDRARPAELRTSAVGGPTQESWWGRAEAYGCRQGFRYVGSPGFSMFSGFCIIALLDAILS